MTLAEPLPEKASTAKTWKLYELPKPCLAQKAKWLPTVTVPDLRWLVRTDQYLLYVRMDLQFDGEECAY